MGPWYPARSQKKELSARKLFFWGPGLVTWKPTSVLNESVFPRTGSQVTRAESEKRTFGPKALFSFCFGPRSYYLEADIGFERIGFSKNRLAGNKAGVRKKSFRPESSFFIFFGPRSYYLQAHIGFEQSCCFKRRVR